MTEFIFKDETPFGRRGEFTAAEHVKWAVVQTSRYPASPDLGQPRLGGVEIKVTDMARQATFYQEQFGFSRSEEFQVDPSEIVLEQGPGEAVVVLRAGGEAAWVDDAERERAVLTRPTWMSIMTSDMDEAADRLKNSAATVYRDLTPAPRLARDRHRDRRPRR